MAGNEKRLIDAHKIEDLFYKQVEYGATDLMDAFDDALQDAQTVDAVEVVRCKDCKHWCYEYDDVGLCVTDVPDIDGVQRLADDFCSYGERRTDAN